MNSTKNNAYAAPTIELMAIGSTDVITTSEPGFPGEDNNLPRESGSEEA